ncbi:uncharacterized protein [Triticum aestivum]|uniref:uncharacterized protein n=1 Tax=Triticum aestivum TaxID=4565 RepID=UPI001D006B82|nr:uncharacterized protein LOC123086689 [Triticum aestivum]
MFGPPIKDLGDVLRYALSTHQKTGDVTENLKNYMLRSRVMRAPLVCASVAASTGRSKLQPTSKTLWFRLTPAPRGRMKPTTNTTLFHLSSPFLIAADLTRVRGYPRAPSSRPCKLVQKVGET